MEVKKNPVSDIRLTYNIILSKGIGRLTREAEKQIYILVQNAIRKNEGKFFLEDDKKDSIQTSYLNILQNWQSFNPEKTTSAFAYFTEVHKRSTTEFINTWYNKKGIKKEEQDTVRFVSINSSNNGQGLYNL